jgi:RNA polymerase sigma-70 factor (ECF subfamily)
VIYLLFNEGYLATAGPPQSRHLVEEADWLAGLLHQLMPAEPEVAGLLALIRLHRARSAGRFSSDGGIVLIRDQDRSLWDARAIADAIRLLAQAARRQRPGPYQLQAAIVACHAEASRWEDTDWEQIVLLYDMLLHLAPSPVTRLHRAVAVRHVSGVSSAMAELDDLADALDEYHLYHASRAELLRELGEPGLACHEDRRALELTTNPAEQAVLRRRIGWACGPAGASAEPASAEPLSDP